VKHILVIDDDSSVLSKPPSLEALRAAVADLIGPP